MAEDISPQIYEQLTSSINQNNARNRKENRIAVDAENGKVDLRSASEYAGLRGKDVANALLGINGSDLPNGKMYYNIAEKAVRPVLNDMTEQVLDVADQAVTATNKAAGIGIKAVRPDETEKVKGILDLASSKDWDDVKNEVASSTENLARKCVDDSVRENADFQYRAGMDPKIVRTASRGACDWCWEVAGTYNYADVSDRGNDVFRRHADCSCLVEYEPVKGKRRTVSSSSYRQNRDSITPEERETQLLKGIGSGTERSKDIPPHDPPKKIKSIDVSDLSQVNSVLSDFESRVLDSDIEHALVIFPNGDVYECFGIDTRVWPDEDFGIDYLNDTIIAHNHTAKKSDFSFGADDAEIFRNSGIIEMYGFDYKYRYKLSKIDKDVDEPAETFPDTEDYQHEYTIFNAMKFGYGYRRNKR